MSRVVINGESADYFNTIEGVLYSSRFGAEVMLYGKNVSEEYLTRCADYFDTLPGEISEKLRQATAAYLNDMLEVKSNHRTAKPSGISVYCAEYDGICHLRFYSHVSIACIQLHGF